MVRTNECLCVRLSPVRVCVHEYIESLAHFIQTRLCHFLLSPAPYFPGLFIFSFHFNSTFSVVCRWCVCCYQRKRNFIVPKSVLCIFRIAALFQLVAQRTKKNTTHFIIIYKHNIFMKVSNISFTIRSTVLSLFPCLPLPLFTDFNATSVILSVSNNSKMLIKITHTLTVSHSISSLPPPTSQTKLNFNKGIFVTPFWIHLPFIHNLSPKKFHGKWHTIA